MLEMTIKIRRVGDNTLILVINDEKEITIRGNYGEGCAVEADWKILGVEEINSQDEFQVIERQL